MPPPPTDTPAALPMRVGTCVGAAVPLQQSMFPAAVSAHALLGCPCPATLATPEDTAVARLTLPAPKVPDTEPSLLPSLVEPGLPLGLAPDGPESPGPALLGQSAGHETNVSPLSHLPSPQPAGQFVRQSILSREMLAIPHGHVWPVTMQAMVQEPADVHVPPSSSEPPCGL
jgi:hypothetical protein